MKNFWTDTARKLGLPTDKAGLKSLFTPPARISQAQVERNKHDDKTADQDSSLMRTLVGSISAITGFYFPRELIGGCCPRVVGSEQDIVWNAAAEAADSERLHVVWQAVGDKIWYLAVRSEELASHPNTWCPFAALLPGMKHAGSLPACYIFINDEVAVMLTITADSLQIHRGSSSVIRAKGERIGRELGNIPLHELLVDQIDKLTPVPWHSLSLFEDRARRILAALSVGVALALSIVAFCVWFLATTINLVTQADLAKVQERKRESTQQLIRMVQDLHASPVREQLQKLTDTNDGLLDLNGYLEFYQIKGEKPLWRAKMPANVTSNRITELGAVTLDTLPDGIVIGNRKEALNPDMSKSR